MNLRLVTKFLLKKEGYVYMLKTSEICRRDDQEHKLLPHLYC